MDSAPPSPHFDLSEKLTQRLHQHNAELSKKRHALHVIETQYVALTKSAPRRPKESKSALTSTLTRLERERTVTSVSLSKEKALLREIGAAQRKLREHDAADRHAETTWRKRSESESAKEQLKQIQSSVREIEKVLGTVTLAKRLGCTPSELVSRELVVGVDRMHLVGDAGEDGVGVHVEVDRIHGKVVVRGAEGAVSEALRRIEERASQTEEAVEISVDAAAYFTGLNGALLELLGGIRYDFLTRMNRIVLHGTPAEVLRGKSLLETWEVASRSLSVGKQVAVVGKCLFELSEKHRVVTSLSRENASVRVIGPPDNVAAAMDEVTALLFDNEQIKESFTIDRLMKGVLIQNSGAGIKEFEHSVSAAVGSGVFLSVERAPGEPTLSVKCSRAFMERAKSLVGKKIAQFESNTVTVEVSTDISSAIIGKGGSNIESLQQMGAGASVDVDRERGTVKIHAHDAETRHVVRAAVEKIVAENQVGQVDIEPKTIGLLFGESGKEVMGQIEAHVSKNEDGTKLILRGTKENIASSSEILIEFIRKNHVHEMDIPSEDVTLLFGATALLQKIESEYGVRASYRKERGVLVFRGEAEKVDEAKKEVERFLYGGDGVTVCKFNVPEEAIGSIVGKGGSNLAKLETDFEGVRIHIPKNTTTVSIRGPEDLVKKCRVRLVTDIATLRVSDTVDISPEQHGDLADSDVIKKIAGGTNTSIALNEGSVKIKGVSRDVRDAKALLREHFTGNYSGFVDLDESQYTRLKSTVSKDPSHFERVKLSTGANVSLDESDYVIKITGKKSNVKKAKLSLIGILDFLFPKQIQAVKVHKTLFKSMGDPEKLAEIAAATGASVYLDRDLISVLINCESPDDATKALDLVNARLIESEKLNYVFRLATSDSWLLPVIIGKGGKSVKKIEAETGCAIDIFKDELAVVVHAESEEAVALGKEVLEAMVDQARKECVFIDLPESAIPAFVGKGGAHIKQLASDHDVEIERMKKHTSTIKISGKEEAVAEAKNAVLLWINEWESSHIGLTINVEEQFIPCILGKGGETIKAIQKDTGCKIDVDRIHSTLTVREGTVSSRAEAMNRVNAIVDEEKAIAAERAAEKEKFRQEQAELARTNAKTRGESSTPRVEDVVVAESSGSKDRTKEFSARPVGSATKSKGNGSKTLDAIETGTKEGRELYLMLISGDETTDEQDDQWEWDSSTVSSSAAMISVCDSSNFGENDLHYRSISGFTVRI